MEPGDRVTIMVGPDRLSDGEFSGWAVDGKARVWLPGKGTTRSYSTDQLAILSLSRVRGNRARSR